MKSHMRKLIAPIVIICIAVAYYIIVGFCISYIPAPFGGKLLLFIIPAAFIGVSIYVLIQRINEVRSGEEDDLSQY